MMLEEVAEDEARKEAKEADAKQTEANEVSVIIQGYSNNSKKKRPFKQVDDSGDNSSNAVLSAVKSTGTTDFIQRLIDGVTASTPSNESSVTVSNDEVVIAKFAQHLSALGSLDLLVDIYSDCRMMPVDFDSSKNKDHRCPWSFQMQYQLSDASVRGHSSNRYRKLFGSEDASALHPSLLLLAHHLVLMYLSSCSQ